MEMPRLKEKFSAAADREGLRAEGEGKGGGGEKKVWEGVIDKREYHNT